MHCTSYLVYPLPHSIIVVGIKFHAIEKQTTTAESYTSGLWRDTMDVCQFNTFTICLHHVDKKIFCTWCFPAMPHRTKSERISNDLLSWFRSYVFFPRTMIAIYKSWFFILTELTIRHLRTQHCEQKKIRRERVKKKEDAFFILILWIPMEIAFDHFIRA